MARLTVALGFLLLSFPVAASAQDTSGDLGVRATFNLALPSAPATAGGPCGLAGSVQRHAGPDRRPVGAGTGRPACAEGAATASASLMASLYGANNLQVQYANAAIEDRKSILGIPAKYADLRIDGSVFLELRSDRLRNLTCTPSQLLDQNSGCRGGFKAPRLDNEFNAKVGGLIGSRLHLNVDYDSRREFNANNDIQVYYQGLQDEILQRVEIGTVRFRAPPSRFLTASIPANNFGVNATFEFGAFTLQGMMATQEGSVVGQRVYTVGATTSEPQDRIVRDLDFESGRFFWAVDPVDAPELPLRGHPEPRCGGHPARPSSRRTRRSASTAIAPAWAAGSTRTSAASPPSGSGPTGRSGWRAPGSCCCRAPTTTSTRRRPGLPWRRGSTRTTTWPSATRP